MVSMEVCNVTDSGRGNSDTNCKDSGSIVQQLNGVFVYPGVNDLRTVNWNDAIGSFKCQYFNDSGEKK